MTAQNQDISLKMFAEDRFIPLIQNVVEQASLAFGLERNAALKLTMGAEELISHLSQTAKGTEVNITISDKGWCVIADFSFVADPSELWAMNLISKDDIACGINMECLGLLLAARMSDGFSVKLDGKIVHLELRKNRIYPVMNAQPAVRNQTKGPISIVENPEPALIKEACLHTINLYPAHLIPEMFHRPEMVIDMLAHSDIYTAVAMDEIGTTAGIIIWRSPSPQSVSFSGPYVFVENSNTAEILETHLLNTVAHTSALSLFSDLATDDLGTHNFEKMGQIDFIQPDNSPTPLKVWFRSMHEDAGATVWGHPSMHDFLKNKYDSLVLMRNIRDADNSSKNLPSRSVFSTQLRPELKEASLSPLVAGADAGDIIGRFVSSLENSGYRNIFFNLDLAYGWQAGMGGILQENGFIPKLILPHAGKSDVVMFQHV